MAVVGVGGTGQTYLEAVNGLLMSTGKGKLISLVSPSRHTELAMKAVTHGRDVIFYKKLWQWRREHLAIDLVAGQMWYELPVDYHKMASPLSLNRPDKMVAFVNYDDMLIRWPFLRSFPPGSGVADVTSAIQLSNQTDTYGTPDTYTIWHQDYLGLMRIPDADFVEEEDARIFGHYWKQAPILTSDNDQLGIPREMMGAHELLSSSHYKKALEFGDWASEKSEGLQLLAERTGDYREDEETNVYHNPQINYNE